MPGSFQISVFADTERFSKAFLALAEDQIPFATAKALTRIAMLGRDRARDSLSDSFKIRSPRTAKGFDFKRAEKRDWPNPVAEVGHKDEFLIPHIDGGVKRSRSGENVAIPTRYTDSRRGSSGAVPRSLTPKTLLSRKKGVFKIPDERIGRKLTAEQSATGKVESLTLWLLRREVRIKPRWPFGLLMQEAHAQSYEDVFREELFKAIETAK
jgi:hypothetical protein